MRNENYRLLGVLTKRLAFVGHSFFSVTKGNPAYSPGGDEMLCQQKEETGSAGLGFLGTQLGCQKPLRVLR